MKKLRIFVVMMLCVSLLAFAGCGNNDTDGDAGNGTVTEEATDAKDNNGGNNGDSVTDDMADDAKDAIDDVKDGTNDNGSNRDDAATETDKK